MQTPKREEIMGVIKNILHGECEIDKNVELHEGKLLQNDINLDSVGLLTLAALIENYYGITLGEDTARPPQTLGDVVNLVKLRLQERFEKEK